MRTRKRLDSGKKVGRSGKWENCLSYIVSYAILGEGGSLKVMRAEYSSKNSRFEPKIEKKFVIQIFLKLFFNPNYSTLHQNIHPCSKVVHRCLDDCIGAEGSLQEALRKLDPNRTTLLRPLHPSNVSYHLARSQTWKCDKCPYQVLYPI